MNKILKLFSVLTVSFFVSVGAQAEGNNMSNDQLVKLTTDNGFMLLELWPDVAPMHVEKFKERVSEGFYDGIPFHRVIKGFMAQGGDGSLVGKSVDYTIPLEPSDRKHERGVLSAARTMVRDSATTQFFIMFEPAPHLDGEYSAFGKVVKGLDILDQIQQGDKMVKLELVDVE